MGRERRCYSVSIVTRAASSALFAVGIVAVDSPDGSQTESILYDIGRYEVRNMIMGVPGSVAPVVYGGKVRAVMAYMDRSRMQARNLSPLDLMIYVIGHHDAGWTEFDRDPVTDEKTGLPYASAVTTIPISPSRGGRHLAFKARKQRGRTAAWPSARINTGHGRDRRHQDT